MPITAFYYTGSDPVHHNISSAIYSTLPSSLATATLVVAPALNWNTLGDIAGIVLDSTQTNVIYAVWAASGSGLPQVRNYNLATQTDSLLFSTGATPNGDAFLNICISPDGTTVVASDRNSGGSGSLWRITYPGGVGTNFGSYILPRGLAYDNTGRLFLTASNGAMTHNFIYQINPTTGAVLNTSTAPGDPIGLCFDAGTGWLWTIAVVGAGAGLQAYDPVTLTLKATSSVGAISLGLALASGGDGNIYVVDSFSDILRYNIAGDSWTPNFINNPTSAAGTVSMGEEGIAILVASSPVLNCNNPPAGRVGVAYSSLLSVSGGTAPFTYAITAGGLPPGLSLNTSTGAITGTPTTTGAAPRFSFQVTVTDANSLTSVVNCSIPITAGPPGSDSGLGPAPIPPAPANSTESATELFLWQIQSLPDQVFAWRTQFISHGLKGYGHVGRLLVKYSASAAVTLTFTAFDGTAPSSITLPSTNAIPQRILLTPTFNKFRLLRYSATSSLPFQIEISESTSQVGEWGRSGPYAPYRLIGEG